MYYTMLIPLNTISEQQTKPTQNTESEITHFLDYAYTNSTAIVQCKASYILLHIDRDVSYLSKPWEHIRTGGH